MQVLFKGLPRGEEVDVDGLSSESSSAVADILCRISSSIPLLLQVPSVMCAYSAATAGVVLEAASSSTSPCARPKAIQKGYIPQRGNPAASTPVRAHQASSTNLTQSTARMGGGLCHWQLARAEAPGPTSEECLRK